MAALSLSTDLFGTSFSLWLRLLIVRCWSPRISTTLFWRHLSRLIQRIRPTRLMAHNSGMRRRSAARASMARYVVVGKASSPIAWVIRSTTLILLGGRLMAVASTDDWPSHFHNRRHRHSSRCCWAAGRGRSGGRTDDIDRFSLAIVASR